MHIFIEGKKQNIKTEQNVLSKSFDIYKNQYICEVVTKQATSTSIYNYLDFDLMFCFITKDKKEYIRFVLYNVKLQTSFVLFEIGNYDSVQIFRLNKYYFIALCTTKNNTTMFCVNIKNKDDKNSKFELNNVHQIGFFNNEYVLINNSKQDFDGYVHTIMLYESREDVLRIVYSLKSKYYAHLRYIFDKNKLSVFDVHSTKIIYNCNIKK